MTVQDASRCQTVSAPSRIWSASSAAPTAMQRRAARARAAAPGGERERGEAERHAAGEHAVRVLERDAQIRRPGTNSPKQSGQSGQASPASWARTSAPSTIRQTVEREQRREAERHAAERARRGARAASQRGGCRSSSHVGIGAGNARVARPGEPRCARARVFSRRGISSIVRS